MSIKCKVPTCTRDGNEHYNGSCRSCARRFERNGSYDYVSNSHGRYGIMKSGLEPIFNMMHQRCSNVGNKSYINYGARGIKVCDRWSGKDGIINFIEDMGERPQGTSIDRKDNDGNYEPSNCRWANRHEQASNKTNSSEIHTGVVKVKDRNLFESSLIVNKIRYRKFFRNIQDAIKYRKELEHEHKIT